MSNFEEAFREQLKERALMSANRMVRLIQVDSSVSPEIIARELEILRERLFALYDSLGDELAILETSRARAKMGLCSQYIASIQSFCPNISLLGLGLERTDSHRRDLCGTCLTERIKNMKKEQDDDEDLN